MRETTSGAADRSTGSESLWLAERSVRERPLAFARRALQPRGRSPACPRYLAALERALWTEFPPFAAEAYAELFRSASDSGQWVAMWLMRVAETEGQRARRLWGLAARGAGGKDARLLKQHAVDESDHALAYLALLDVVFPGAVPAQFRRELDALSPHYTPRQKLSAEDAAEGEEVSGLDGHVRLNLEELRAAARLVLLRDAIARYASGERLARAAERVDALLRDELRHVAYTARLIEDGARAEERPLAELLCTGLRDYNRATSEDALDYSYHVRFGNYP